MGKQVITPPVTKTRIAAASATRGGDYIPLGPGGTSAPRKRNVVCTFGDANVGYLSSGSGFSTFTIADLPLAGPNGQTKGAKVAIAGSANAVATLRSYTFAAAAAGSVPSSLGLKSFAKAVGQVLYALVYVDGDPYQLNTAYTDSIQVRFEKDGSNYVDWFFSTSSFRLKAGWNMLLMRWDGATSSVEAVPSVTGSVADGSTITRVLVGAQSGTGTLTYYVAEAGYYDAAPGRPLIALTFDGYYAEHVSRALPLLQAKGVKATFTTGAGYSWNEPTLTAALMAGGMEVGHQIYQHIDYPQNGDSTYGAELDKAIGYARALGHNWRVQSMPYNDITKAQVAIAGGKGVRIVREARQIITPIVEWGAGAGMISGAYGIGQFGADNITLAALKAAADGAVRYGGLVAMTCHQLVTGGTSGNTTGSSTQTYVEHLGDFIEYAKTQGCTFVTLSQVVRSLDALSAVN